VAFLQNFARQAAVLRGIAEKELAGQPLSKEQEAFLKALVQLDRRGSGFAGYTGWYPSLFYPGTRDCEKWDAIVADVHTDPPDDMHGDPGCVLHEGVGNVDLLVVAVDSGKDRMVYAGPVLSHYEFEVPGVARKSDSEWREDVKAGRLPPRPEWTRGYLVPGGNKDAKAFRYEP
jgi:hypothetical protein